MAVALPVIKPPSSGGFFVQKVAYLPAVSVL
jgi:hypothetical protein